MNQLSREKERELEKSDIIDYFQQVEVEIYKYLPSKLSSYRGIRSIYSLLLIVADFAHRDKEINLSDSLIDFVENEIVSLLREIIEDKERMRDDLRMFDDYARMKIQELIVPLTSTSTQQAIDISDINKLNEFRRFRGQLAYRHSDESFFLLTDETFLKYLSKHPPIKRQLWNASLLKCM